MTFAEWCKRNGIELAALSSEQSVLLETRWRGGAPQTVPATLNAVDVTATLNLAEPVEGESLRRFTMNAYNGGAVLIDLYYLPVVIDLAGLTIPTQTRPVLLNHDRNRIVGHTETIALADTRIDAEGVISAANEHAREVTQSAGNGFPWQCSIGVSPDRVVFVDDEETVDVNGRQFTGPILVTRAGTLKEISFCPLGADDTTSATVAAHAASSQTLEVYPMDFEKWLKAKGFDDIAKLSDPQKKSLRAMFDAEQASATAGNGEAAGGNGNPTVPPVNAAAAGGATTATLPAIQPASGAVPATREIEAAEIERVGQLRTLFAAANFDDRDTIHAQAVRDGWDSQRAELEILRRNRQQAPNIHSHSHDGDCTTDVLQAAMMLRLGLKLDAPHWGTMQARALLDRTAPWLGRQVNDDVRQRAMDMSHRFADTSLLDLCREATRLDGNYVAHGRSDIIEAASSGGSLTRILTSSFNAVLLSSYMESGDTTMGWCQEEDVPDFKLNERPRMLTSDDLEKIAAGKEAKHDTYDDTGESYRIARYAKQSEVDEIVIINDRLGALRDGAMRHGIAARRLRPNLVYAALLANATLVDGVALFNAASHGNDAAAVLGSATLKTGIAAIETQTENGVTLGLRASHLITPSALKHVGAELINSSTIVIAGDTDTVRGSTNTIASEESLSLVSDGRLDNGVVDPDSGVTVAGAPADWYLAAAAGHTIEVGYLRGSGRAPVVRTYTLQRGRWGVGWDVKMDIGVCPKDFRSFYRGRG